MTLQEIPGTRVYADDDQQRAYERGLKHGRAMEAAATPARGPSRPFKDTVEARWKADAQFREALINEVIEGIEDQDYDTAIATLKDIREFVRPAAPQPPARPSEIPDFCNDWHKVLMELANLAHDKDLVAYYPDYHELPLIFERTLARIAQLESNAAGLVEALEFYANREYYDDHEHRQQADGDMSLGGYTTVEWDEGEKARAALASYQGGPK